MWGNHSSQPICVRMSFRERPTALALGVIPCRCTCRLLRLAATPQTRRLGLRPIVNAECNARTFYCHHLPLEGGGTRELVATLRSLASRAVKVPVLVGVNIANEYEPNFLIRIAIGGVKGRKGATPDRAQLAPSEGAPRAPMVDVTSSTGRGDG